MWCDKEHAGIQTFQTVIEKGENIIDISFFMEEPFTLQRAAKTNKAIAVMDCGVAPELSNALVKYALNRLDKTHYVNIYVGGLPVVREWPFEYKAVFSFSDILEEYIRPARYVENGQIRTKPALSEPELINFPSVGTLEAFNTDGLRTLLKLEKVPNIKEKTLRYPGHVEKMAVFREAGFLSKKPIEVNKTSVRPIDVTTKLLFPLWKLKEGEEDLTILRVIVEGCRKEEQIRNTDLLTSFGCNRKNRLKKENLIMLSKMKKLIL